MAVLSSPAVRLIASVVVFVPVPRRASVEFLPTSIISWRTRMVLKFTWMNNIFAKFDHASTRLARRRAYRDGYTPRRSYSCSECYLLFFEALRHLIGGVVVSAVNSIKHGRPAAGSVQHYYSYYERVLLPYFVSVGAV